MITGKQIGQIVAALLSAFPTRADLAMLVTMELDRHLSVIRATLQEVHEHVASIADRDLAEGVAAAQQLAEDPSLDARHKLEVTIPIIPLLLDYKFETELGSRANLVALWETLKTKVQGKREAPS